MNPRGNDDRFTTLRDGKRDIIWEHDHVATWKDMEKLLKTNKTKAIGVCNYSIPYLEKLLAHADVIPAVNQIKNHSGLTQQSVVDFFKSRGIHIMAYSPLGSSGGPLMRDEKVRQLAEEKNVSPSTILLSYAGELIPRPH